MHPKELSILDFTYDLPEDKIARYPLPERDSSKLLVYKNGLIKESVYSKLDEELPADALLVFNNTKVVEARLLFTKSTGGIIEIFCLEPDEQYADITSAMLQQQKVLWKCLVGGAKKWKEDFLVKTIDLGQERIELTAKIAEKKNDYFLIEFNWNSHISFAELLHHAGVIPLPPYLNRTADESDKSTYQTIYAKHDGSVAAPTAGLHFTENLFEKLEAKGIQKSYVTLHVGAGTFKPVKAAVMAEHEMHAEFIDVDANTIQQLIAYADKTIVAVGTTSLRTIESLYWMGVVMTVDSGRWTVGETLTIHQWDAYELPQDITVKDALNALLDWMKENNLQRIIAKTQIIIAPSYELRVAKGLVTNFHQPQSTLLLLVASIIGNDWKKVYTHALENCFRFLSYGDGCLLWK